MARTKTSTSANHIATEQEPKAARKVTTLNPEQFAVFCTVDVSSELLTKFLLHTHFAMNDGQLDQYDMQCAILRSQDLASVTERTPIPTIDNIPEPLISPFPDWTPERIKDFLSANSNNTHIVERNFLVIDARSLKDSTCLIGDGCEGFKTLRSTFRDALLAVVNYNIGNMGIEEQIDAVGDDGVSAIGETEESIAKDREECTIEELFRRCKELGEKNEEEKKKKREDHYASRKQLESQND